MEALAKDVQEERISRIFKGTLELIHFGVCGQIPSTYLSGYEYYVTFTDDYSRNTWIYFLKTKNEVVSTQNVPKVVECKSQGNRETTLRKGDGFFLYREGSLTIF